MKNRLIQLLNAVKNKHIAVIGDVMLDEYYWGEVNRVSPEAPVPVVDVVSKSEHIGGAANVAQNLLSFGITPLLFGLIGDDEAGEKLLTISKKLGINTGGLYKDNSRKTTLKTRIIGNNQQIVRMDTETRTPIDDYNEQLIITQIINARQLDAIIFEDYNKGTINNNIISEIIKFANQNNIPIFVDPKKRNFTSYRSTTLFKPNKKETEFELNTKLSTKEDIINAGKKLLSDYHFDNVLITLGANGMMLFEKTEQITHIDTVARSVADVSGAGDTAIATLATMFIAGATMLESCKIANVAAGIACEKTGVVAITADELIVRI